MDIAGKGRVEPPDSPVPEGDNTSVHEASFSRQVSTIIEKFEKDFHRRERSIEKFHGEAELEKQQAEFERELWLVRAHLLEERPSIDYDNGEELKEMIANKLAVSSPNKAHSSDWWWASSDPSIQELLRDVQRALEAETKSKTQPWRRGMSHAWSVLSELIYLAIVVGVFSAATSKFETVVFSALVMIYNAVTSRISGVGLGAIYLMCRIEDAYGEIGRALGLKVTSLSG